MTKLVAESSFRAVDGGSITVSSPAARIVDQEWSGRFFLREAGNMSAFEVHPRGAGMALLGHRGVMRVADRWKGSAGEFSIVSEDGTESSLGLWSGSHHDLLTWFNGPVPTQAQVRRRFARLRWTDGAKGLAVAPASAVSGARIEQQEYLISLETSAMVVVRDPRSFGDMAPKTAGAKTKHGEVWKRTATHADGSTSAFYAVATPTALSVYYAADAGVAKAADLHAIDNLNVHWTR